MGVAPGKDIAAALCYFKGCATVRDIRASKGSASIVSRRIEPLIRRVYTLYGDSTRDVLAKENPSAAMARRAQATCNCKTANNK
eukprot:COSAG05_NODE_1872_length_3917_cov_8.508381_3_plen_84_part_00